MANNRDIRVDIDGDSSGLSRALRQATDSLDEFGGHAGGLVGDVAERLSGGFGRAGLAMTGVAGAIGVAGAAIAITLAKVSEQAEKAFEVFKAANLSQMGIAQIQQMANMYAQVGLNMENIADQQKDIKDKLGDAFNNLGGSMYTDVIQPLGLNLLELKKMADEGQDVYAKIYFAAKAQGYSASQMTFMMETLGNDAVLRLSVLKQFNSEQDYQNSLSQQTIQLTQEQSDQFAEYRKATTDLSNAWEQWENSTLAPIASRLAEILNLMTRIMNSKPVSSAAAATGEEGINAVKQYQQGYQDDLLKNSSIYGAQIVEQNKKDTELLDKNLSYVVSLAQANMKDLKTTIDEANKGVSKSTIEGGMKAFETTKQAAQGKIDQLDQQYKFQKEAIQKSLLSAYGDDFKAQKKALDSLESSYKEKRGELVKAMNASDEAAKKALESKLKAEQRLQEQANAKRLAAQKALDKAISDSTANANLRQIAEYDRQQKELMKVIADNAKVLGIDPSQLLKTAAKTGAQNRNNMLNQMIGYQDPNQGLKDTNLLIGSGNLSDQQKGFLANQQNQRINGNNPFAYDNTDQRLKDNEDAMNAELAQNDLLLKGHEDYEKRKAQITAKYNSQAIEISNQNAQDQLSIFGNTADQLANGMVAAFGKSSGAAQAAFAVSKGITIAQTILSINSALAQALATPFPASLANYAQVLSLGMSIISTAKGAASGQFHGGVDDLPAGYDNKSFVLKAGERVVQPEANKKLTKFLDKQEGGSTSGDVTINAPLIIQGDVAGDDKKFNEMLKKHQNSVAQAYRSSIKRNT